LHASPNIIRVIKSWRMRWAVHVTYMGQMRNAYKILDGKPEGKKKFRYRWEDNSRMDLGESRVGSCGLDTSSPGLGTHGKVL